ncbi:MAG: 50S ribosomal protein L23 [Candidatus Yanofskybacteria bacterium]|nr:50S ribosomal protein L23 [Candidatus Yanofskybacteria bacterium]
MLLKNFFKKSKKEKAVVEKKAVQETGDAVKNLPSVSLKGDDFSFQVLVGPHITEKASIVNNLNQYIFKVFKNVNKLQIKRAVEKLYEVNVDDIKILNMPAKKRKLGRTEGERSGFKKAMVKLKKGHKIDLIPK